MAPGASATAQPERQTRFRRLWHTHIVQSPAYPRILICLAFLITFLLVRGTTYSIKYHWLPFLHNISVAGGTLHIHHLVWGILLLLLTGFVASSFDLHRTRPLVAVLYGIGAALTLDEFALWLRLEDVYWATQGRESIDAVILVDTLFLLSILLGPFLRAVIKELRRLQARAISGSGRSERDTVRGLAHWPGRHLHQQLLLAWDVRITLSLHHHQGQPLPPAGQRRARPTDPHYGWRLAGQVDRLGG